MTGSTRVTGAGCMTRTGRELSVGQHHFEGECHDRPVVDDNSVDQFDPGLFSVARTRSGVGFLSSQESSQVFGETLNVNGGMPTP